MLWQKSLADSPSTWLAFCLPFWVMLRLHPCLNSKFHGATASQTHGVQELRLGREEWTQICVNGELIYAYTRILHLQKPHSLLKPFIFLSSFRKTKACTNLNWCANIKALNSKKREKMHRGTSRGVNMNQVRRNELIPYFLCTRNPSLWG